MVQKYSHNTIGTGICTPEFIFHVDGDILVELEMPRRGCDGNLKGIASLIKGMKIDDIIERCQGITCG
ncbi:MAG: TSCPD domain-containing protein, partial [Clostridia bacterium]|nr:TSCPD domain-containing protein [Clostridia bacterium]